MMAGAQMRSAELSRARDIRAWTGSRAELACFETWEMPVSEWPEDYEAERVTVKMTLWKSNELVNTDAAEEVDSIQCFLYLDEVVAETETPVSNASHCLSEIEIRKECHARMIAKLLHYIESQDIDNSIDHRDMVVMDIVKAPPVTSGSIIEMALQRSMYPNTPESEEIIVEPVRQWVVMDMGMHQSWAWPEEAGGNIQVAIKLLRRFERLGEALSQLLEEDRARVVPANEAAITSLEKIQQGEFYCSICLGEDDNKSAGFLRMPCLDVFHTVCLETWLRIGYYCPLCRYALPH
ncbi:hypothetical protein QQ045_026122 [Rhodiola kirilowii]